MNAIFVTGNLGRDPTLRFTTSGIAVCEFSICTSYGYKSKAGEDVKEACWLEVTAFGGTAERVNEQCRKGSNVLVIGRMKQEKWLDKDEKPRSKLYMHAEEIYTRTPIGPPAVKPEPKPEPNKVPRDLLTGEPDPGAPTGDDMPF